MLLASVVVVYIRSEEGDGGGQSLDQYTIYDESDESGDTVRQPASPTPRDYP